jgi:hypothetical protein
MKLLLEPILSLSYFIDESALESTQWASRKLYRFNPVRPTSPATEDMQAGEGRGRRQAETSAQINYQHHET